MSSWNLCEECGVPRLIADEYLWLDNGEIVQKRNKDHRVILAETENLDPVFRGIGDLIGSSIERIVITCVRRTVCTYLKLFLPLDVGEQIKEKKISIISKDDSLIELSRTSGSGRFEFVDMRYEGDDDDYYTVKITEPYSVPMTAATHCAAMEAILGYDHDVTYVQTAPDVYNLTAFPSPHPDELKGRLYVESYVHGGGDIEFERCATCGGPKALSGFKWDLDRAVIVEERSKRRVAILGSRQIDPIFAELEEELGKSLPRVVVESQRRFTKTGYFTMNDYPSVDDFRIALALRGLGNLKKFDINRRSFRIRLENAVLPLMIVGMIQGIFDAAVGTDSVVHWELSEQGDLEVEVTAIS